MRQGREGGRLVGFVRLFVKALWSMTVLGSMEAAVAVAGKKIVVECCLDVMEARHLVVPPGR